MSLCPTWPISQLGRLFQFKTMMTTPVAAPPSNSLASQVGAGDDDAESMDLSLAKLESEAKEVARVNTTAPINSIAPTRFAMMKAATATH